MTSRTPYGQHDPRWNPYRAEASPTRPPWWRRRWVVVTAAVLVGLMGLGIAGGSAQEPTVTGAGAAAAPASPWVTPTTESVPTQAAEPEPVEVVETPAVVESVVPDLVGLSPRRALKKLTKAGLVAGVITRVPSDQPVGTVLDQGTATGESVALGSVVAVTVAAPYPAVPEVTGDARTAAARSLRRAGFAVRVRTERRTSGREGAVLSQSPAGSTRLAPGSVVTLVVAHVVAPPPPPEPEPEPEQSCTAGYDPCLPPASDYDCGGGSGNGPEYAYETVRVTGSDPYDLDSDGDGFGCE